MFNPPKAKGKVLPDKVYDLKAIRKIGKVIEEYTSNPDDYDLWRVAIEVYEIARGERDDTVQR